MDEPENANTRGRMLTPTELEALRQSQRDAFVILRKAFPNARMEEMQTEKREQPAPSFEEVVRKMLNTPPSPHKPKARTKAKKRTK
jgi:hypothetical protein